MFNTISRGWLSRDFLRSIDLTHASYSTSSEKRASLISQFHVQPVALEPRATVETILTSTSKPVGEPELLPNTGWVHSEHARTHAPTSCLYADRAPGRHRDHRGVDRPVVAGGPVGPRSRPTNPVCEQPEAAWPRDAQLRELEQRPAAPDGPDIQYFRWGVLEVELECHVADHPVPGAGDALQRHQLHEQGERSVECDGRLDAIEGLPLPERAQPAGVHQHQQRGRDLDVWRLELRLVRGDLVQLRRIRQSGRPPVRSARTWAAGSLRSPMV